MPEAAILKPAPKTPEINPGNLSPAEQAGGELVENRQTAVSNNIDTQVTGLGLTQPGQIPRSAPHVDAAMQQGIDKRAAEIGRTDLKQPDIYEDKTALSGLSSIHDSLDLADQYVTGRTHRVADNNEFSAPKKEMIEDKLKHKNRPSEEPGVLTRIGNWFLEEKKAA